MKLSVIIPVYNEKNTILGILEKIKAVDIGKEIIIVDDGSTDGTREILKEVDSRQSTVHGKDQEEKVSAVDRGLWTVDKKNQIKVIFHNKNQGKGMAIRTGLKAVTGDVVIIQDADLEYDPADYPELVRPIQEGKASVVYGSRILGDNRKSYWSFYLGGRLLSFIANVLYGARITDEPTCYKAFRADVIKAIDLKCSRFEFCPEVTAKVKKKGYDIYEVPIRYYPRSVEEGKKINLRDGIEAVWTLIKYRFIP